MRHAFEIDGAEHELWLGRAPGGGYELHALGRVAPVGLALDEHGAGTLVTGGATVPVVIAQRGDEVFVHVDGVNWRLRLRHPLERAGAETHAGADDEVRAPMPGTAVSVAVNAGDHVVRGAAMLVMESMKLETTVTAARDATIRSVHVAAGQAFDRDSVLVTFEPPEAA
jgi:acetyl/propionyl-CoA carboxylase alpha subunit